MPFCFFIDILNIKQFRGCCSYGPSYIKMYTDKQLPDKQLPYVKLLRRKIYRIILNCPITLSHYYLAEKAAI